MRQMVVILVLIVLYGLLSVAPLYGGSSTQPGLTQDSKSASAEVGKPAREAKVGHHAQAYIPFVTQTSKAGYFSPAFFVAGLKTIHTVLDWFGPPDEPVFSGPPNSTVNPEALVPTDDNGWPDVD